MTGGPPAVASPTADAELPAYLAALGLPGIVDVHTHFMPRSVMAKVWAYFDAAGPLVGRRWPIAYRWEESERLERLRALGVRAFSSLVYPHKPAMATWLNAWAADFADRTPGCLRTATFFPEPEAPAYVEAALAGGAQVFKAHVQVGGYDPRDPLLTPVWGQLADAGVPVVTHCGSGPVAGRFTGPGPMATVLDRHHGLRVVVAHLGYPEVAGFLDLADRHPALLLDTTMAFVDFWGMAPPDRRLTARLAGLADRVLFGSDFPNIPYPYAHQVEVLADAGLGEDWLRRVLWHNGATLFGVRDPRAAGG